MPERSNKLQDFDVKIRETLERTVTVQALSLAHAKDIVEKSYKNCEYVLDAEDYKGVTFHAAYPKNRDYER